MTPTRADFEHMDPCRKCGRPTLRADMVQAKKVLKRSNARGRYCLTCANYLMDLETRLNRLPTAPGLKKAPRPNPL